MPLVEVRPGGRTAIGGDVSTDCPGKAGSRPPYGLKPCCVTVGKAIGSCTGGGDPLIPKLGVRPLSRAVLTAEKRNSDSESSEALPLLSGTTIAGDRFLLFIFPPIVEFEDPNEGTRLST